MELKYSKVSLYICKSFGSNRTFMELKLRNENVPMFEYGVLIAPLWN